MIVQLPNGLLDGVDLFAYAEIDELRGKQQNYLVNREYIINNIGHIPRILEDMVLSFQTKEGLTWKGDTKKAVWQIPSGDIETILIKIRENTYGVRFYHESYCSHCGHKHENCRIDLDTLKLDPMPIEDMLKPKIISLPKMGVDIELRPQYMKDLFEGVAINNDKHDELITAAIATTLKRIGDKVDITSADVDNIPVTDLKHINDKAEHIKIEGSIDTKLEMTCVNPKCKKEFSVRLNPLDPAFFSPTGGSTSLNM